MKKLIKLALISLLSLAALPALAQDLVHGVVEEITLDPLRITIAHDAIPNLGMEAMTMVFRVADVALIEGLAVGDAITFEADRINGRLTVTSLVAE